MGSCGYVKNLSDAERQKILLYLNVESVGDDESAFVEAGIPPAARRTARARRNPGTGPGVGQPGR